MESASTQEYPVLPSRLPEERLNPPPCISPPPLGVRGRVRQISADSFGGPILRHETTLRIDSQSISLDLNSPWGLNHPSRRFAAFHEPARGQYRPPLGNNPSTPPAREYSQSHLPETPDPHL